jgi:hypothetical protein
MVVVSQRNADVCHRVFPRAREQNGCSLRGSPRFAACGAVSVPGSKPFSLRKIINNRCLSIFPTAIDSHLEICFLNDVRLRIRSKY